MDSKFAVSAVEEHIELFGKAPKAYAYDRGGWSQENIAALKKLGVKDVGLAPRGRAEWRVRGAPRRSSSASEPKSKVASERSSATSMGSIGRRHVPLG